MHHRRTHTLLMPLAFVCALVLALGCLGCSASISEDDWNDVLEYVLADRDDEDADIDEYTDDTYEDADEEPQKAPAAREDGDAAQSATGLALSEVGTYTSRDEVAWYLHTYGHLPSNYVTKDEAEDAGWKTEGLTLAEACPGKSIGGDRFGNREGRLPKGSYLECDIDYAGERTRGAKRLVYTKDCSRIYYTEDHYQSFTQLY